MMLSVGFVFGCSSDLETDNNNERLETVKQQIFSLAEEYGMNIELNDAALVNNLNEIDMNEIELFLKSAAKIKGRYPLCSLVKNGKRILSQGEKRNMTRSEKREYSFDEHTEGAYITCYCDIEYYEDDNGKFHDVSVASSVYDANDILVTSVDNTSGYVGWDNIIRVSGYVYLCYSSGRPNANEPSIKATYTVDGSYDGSDGSITWR